MLARQGRDTVQRLPLEWARPRVLIHDGAFTIALASKEDAAFIYLFLLHIKVSNSTMILDQHCFVVTQPTSKNILILIGQQSKHHLILSQLYFHSTIFYNQFAVIHCSTNTLHFLLTAMILITYCLNLKFHLGEC